MKITVSTFYKFVAIADPCQLQAEVKAACEQHRINGTVLIAGEGLNATVSGHGEDIGSLLTWLRADARFGDLTSKESYASYHPFRRLKVKVKPEIVTFGHPEIDPAAGVGTYVHAEDWNALLQDPDVVVVDTRNTYECDVGTFAGAINPKTETFRDFAAFADTELETKRNQKIAMFCTGGIRCEKATAYLRSRGFAHVFHLQGGILKYLEVVPEAQSLWRGDCFIFDDRVSLEHGVTPGAYRRCQRCGNPVRELSGDPSVTSLCANCSCC